MSNFEFFSKDPSQWGKTFASIWGHLDICPLLNQFHLASITYPELSSLTSLRAWGDAEKFHSDISYLLVSTEDEAMPDRAYGLSTVWVNSVSGQGLHCGGSSQATDHLGPQWTQLALHPGVAQWGHLRCATPQGGAPEHPARRWHQ